MDHPHTLVPRPDVASEEADAPAEDFAARRTRVSTTAEGAPRWTALQEVQLIESVWCNRLHTRKLAESTGTSEGAAVDRLRSIASEVPVPAQGFAPRIAGSAAWLGTDMAATSSREPAQAATSRTRGATSAPSDEPAAKRKKGEAKAAAAAAAAAELAVKGRALDVLSALAPEDVLDSACWQNAHHAAAALCCVHGEPSAAGEPSASASSSAAPRGPPFAHRESLGYSAETSACAELNSVAEPKPTEALDLQRVPPLLRSALKDAQ